VVVGGHDRWGVLAAREGVGRDLVVVLRGRGRHCKQFEQDRHRQDLEEQKVDGVKEPCRGPVECEPQDHDDEARD